MALLTKTGSFSAPNTSSGVYSEIDIGFTPKVVFIWLWGGTSSESHYSVNIRSGMSVIFPGSTTHIALGAYVQGGTTSPSVTRRMDSSSAITMAGSTTSVWTRRSDSVFVNATQTGLRFYWNVISVSDSYYGTYLALGGDAIQETAHKWWNMPTSTGSYHVPIGDFRPDLVMTFNVGGNSANPIASSVAAVYGIGAAAGDDQWAMSFYRTPGGWAQRNFEAGKHIVAISGSTDYQRAVYEGMTSTGMNFSTDLTPFGSSMHSMALRGNLKVKVGTFSSTTTTGNVTQTVTGVGFKPQVVIFGSVHDIHRAGPTSIAAIGMGAMDNMGNVSGSLVADGTVARQVATDTYAYVQLLGTAVGQRFSFNSFHDNGFRVNWVSSSNTATRIGYIALAEADAKQSFSSQVLF